ncbi:3D domain-containing protein [Bacillus sp. FJAT-50079]|uniref:3D domain-containing protein n=1 Tax=Bacillus sp. FJAT-50079 TaxID=2833577 RepID=UPI001BC8EA73|nr:3D domain-containing protein [Bacillus sp. FJAT-50079]MBS4207423.1 LysM peptidoglycan-binding domain-containing protein [Bacillus sp. FJAT-50079]
MRKKMTAFVTAVSIVGMAASGASAATHEVKNGDSLWNISQEYGVTVAQMQEWNDLPSDIIHPNEQLNVTPKDASKEHIVSQGDTLWDIAIKYEVTVDDLKQWNQLTSALIHPGDTLIIQNNGDLNKEEVIQLSEEQGVEMTVTATAYTAHCKGCSGITATGQDLRTNPNQKVIAVDPTVIPLGSKVYVEGYGTAIAGDTGGAIKGNKIDLFIPSHEEAVAFGVKTVKIKVLQ